MACNCKKALKLNEMGDKEEESLAGKAGRYLLRSIIFVIALCLGIVLVPLLFVVAVWKISFGDMSKPLVIPDLLSRFRK